MRISVANGWTTLATLRLCLLAVICLWTATVQSSTSTVKIGVLAFRDIDTTRQQWLGLAEYLTTRIPDHQFEITPLHLDELTRATASEKFDFILTQPEHYVLLRSHHRLAAVATLVPGPVSKFGGVIFTLANRNNINGLSDLRGKTVAAAHINSLGGFRTQQWILKKSGIDFPDEAKQIIYTGQPQDKVIDAVLAGKADVGFVRTGLIESLINEGKLDPRAIKIINPLKEKGFPLLLSTELYPEWPFSATHNAPDALIKAVTLALLEIPPDHPAAITGQFQSFMPPADYSALETMMLELRAHPDRLEYFDLRDIIEKYSREAIFALSALLILMLTALVHLMRSKQQVSAALRERASLLNSLGEGVYGVDNTGRCTFINPKALEMLGWSKQEIVGTGQHQLFHTQAPDGSIHRHKDCPISRTLSDEQKREGDAWFCTKGGTHFPVHYSVTRIKGRGKNAGAVVTFRDISDSRKADELVRIAAIAFETQEAMVVTDAKTNILQVNRAFTDVTGFSAEEAVGRTPAILKSGYHEPDFYKEMWSSIKLHGSWRGEIWNRRKNGEIYPEWLTISAVRNPQGETTHYVSTFIDITQRKEAEEQIQFLAFYDPLTRLPNRRLLHERILLALDSVTRNASYAALLVIDVDNFKTLNDSMGHDVGDLLLRQVALRLRESVGGDNTVARIGGDEFVVLLEELGANLPEVLGHIEHAARDMLAALGRPYQFGEIAHHCTASIGAVPFRNGTETTEGLLKSAEMAMYKAKRAGKNTLRFFDPTMQTEIEKLAVLERELRTALVENQFILHFQPQCDQTGQSFGSEALIRWQHPTRGLLQPNDFISIAEETGLIVPIGQWVLEQACRQLAEWQKNPATAHLELAINVSVLQFQDSNFVALVNQALKDSGAPACLLKLEITESLLLQDSDAVIERMHTLKNHTGVSLSLDDFGTGYSSLSYLKRLPLDQIKIDRSFVQEISTNRNDASIAEAVIALGRSFGLKIIAEGVETEEQLKALIDKGCLSFQGYLFARPSCIENFSIQTTQRNSQ